MKTNGSIAHATSEHFPCQDAMPECFGTHLMPIAEKIKKVAAAFPHIAVPAGATRPFRLIDSQGRVTILTIGVMLPKRTTPHPTPIKLDVAANHRERVLRGTPGMDGGSRGDRYRKGDIFC